MLWTKEVWVYPLYDPVNSHSHRDVNYHQYFHTSVHHLVLLLRKRHCLISCRSPSVDDNPLIPEDRPRGPYVLDSSPFRWVPTDHFEMNHHCFSKWSFLACSTSTPWSHRRESRRVYIPSVIGRRPRISLDSSTFESLPMETTSYNISGLRMEIVFGSHPLYASSNTQISSSSVYHWSSSSSVPLSPHSAALLLFQCIRSPFSGLTVSFYISGYEHGNARLVHIFRLFLSHYVRPFVIFVLYLDTSMGMPASSIIRD